MNQSLLSTHAPGDALGHDAAQYRFDCPDLPDAFFVTAFEATEALNEPYRWTARLRAEHEATDSYQLLGRDVSLTIAMRGSERPFRGIVDNVTIGHDAQHVQTCTISVVPALFSLSRTLETRIYQDLDALEIVEAVLLGSLVPYGRTFRADTIDSSRLVTRNYCVQYRETNLAFVHRLLEEEGIGYYFDHASDPETLVLFDDNRNLASIDGAVQYGSASAEWSGSEPLIWFPATFNRTSTSHTTRDYDWRLGDRGVLEASGEISSAGTLRQHEVYEHGVGQHHVIHEDTNMLVGMAETAATSFLGANLPMPLADLANDLKGSVFDRFSSSNTEDRARIRREWYQRDANVFDGVSFITALSAGTAFELCGHPMNGADGNYYVVRVTHSSAPPPPSFAAGELADQLRHVNSHNRVRCLPRTTQWRPDMVTKKPRIDGVQTATVTGPEGLEIYTDPHGRIKVRFPWDRAGLDLSGHYTCWLRVSQAWAGPTSPAFLFIPRVGMEVVVSFVDGDPDRPLVTGCVYNGDNSTPALLPPQMTKSIIRTRTVPMGTGYNELSFEDAMGFERVYLRAERDLSELVQNDHDLRVDRNEVIAVGVNQTERVGRDQTVEVGRHYKRVVCGSAVEITGGDHTRTVRGTAHEEVTHDYMLNIDGVISTRAKGQVITQGGRGVAILQGDATLLRMTGDEATEEGQPGKGLTLMSEGSKIYITKDRIELTVGGSSLVITPELIQANDKTLPAPPAPPGSSR